MVHQLADSAGLEAKDTRTRPGGKTLRIVVERTQRPPRSLTW
jgi:hypothetical protein